MTSIVEQPVNAELHRIVSGARVGRVLIYVCVKRGHASVLGRDWMGAPKAKGTGHALNARMLGPHSLPSIC